MDERNKEPLLNISIRAGGKTYRIPIFTNPTIKESRSANYAEASILYRNEPVKLYTGTAAKRLSFEFKMHRNHYENMNAEQSVDMYLNYIRATVLSTKEEPREAPPVVTISYATPHEQFTRWNTESFPAIPFVVTSYRISSDDSAGYDAGSLNPMQVSVALNLEEYRQKDGVNHEDLPGQEDVIKGNYLV
tara:strand:- start:275 stop:844 length:570 start_codon:yes stop_codon:yes gene_type:complete